MRKCRFFKHFLTIFVILAATQNVECCCFMYTFSESEQCYFDQNLCEKWSANILNKLLFFNPNLAHPTCFPYNTAEVQDINLKLGENKLQYILSWSIKLTSCYTGWLIDYDMYVITTLSVGPRLGF